MSEFKDFSSLSPDKERDFVVYEMHSVQSGKKAKIISLGVSVGFLVLIMSVVFSFPPPEHKMGEDEVVMLGAKSGKKKKQAAEETEAAEAAEAEGEAAEAEGEAAEAETGEDTAE